MHFSTHVNLFSVFCFFFFLIKFMENPVEEKTIRHNRHTGKP